MDHYKHSYEEILVARKLIDYWNQILLLIIVIVCISYHNIKLQQRKIFKFTKLYIKQFYRKIILEIYT